MWLMHLMWLMWTVPEICVRSLAVKNFCLKKRKFG